MTVLFKNEAEKEAHIYGILDQWNAVAKSGDKITRKGVGKLSRQTTDLMGFPNATIPGQKTTDYMDSWFGKTFGRTIQFTPSKNGKRLNATITKP